MVNWNVEYFNIKSPYLKHLKNACNNNYFPLFEGKILFNKLWPLLDLRAELDLKYINCMCQMQQLKFLNSLISDIFAQKWALLKTWAAPVPNVLVPLEEEELWRPKTNYIMQTLGKVIRNYYSPNPNIWWD